MANQPTADRPSGDRSRVYRTHALVLRRRDQGDADRILTLFTPELGRLEVIAKGVRKTSSRKAGHLEPFTHVSLLLAQARTWDIITEVVTVEPFRHLRENLDAIGRAGYVAELVDAFAQSDDEHRNVWDLTTFVLRELDASAAREAAAHARVAASGSPESNAAPNLNAIDRNMLLVWFMLHMLSVSGFQPNLSTCLACDGELQPETNFFNAGEGGFYCPRCAEAVTGAQARAFESVDADVLKIMRFAQSKPWGEVRKFTIRPLLVRSAENLLQRYMMSVLEHHLRSVDFLRRLQNDPRFASPNG
jgi:DNA repair protein RecO (recombination protein O)